MTDGEAFAVAAILATTVTFLIEIMLDGIGEEDDKK